MSSSQRHERQPDASGTVTIQDMAGHYREMLDAAGDVIFLTDTAGRCIQVSPAVEALLGCPPDEVIGRPAVEFVAPEWRRRVRVFYSHQVRDRAARTVFEFPVLAHSGGEKWVQQTTLLHVEDGQVIGLRAHLRDITPYRQSEQELQTSRASLVALMNTFQNSVWSVDRQYRSVVENALDVIFTLNTHGHITWLNPAFETVTGWRREDWISRSFVDIVDAEDLPLAREMYHQALNTASTEALPSFELRIRAASGGPVIGEFKVQRITEGDRVTGILGIVRDVTERKRAEAERDLYINQLEVLQYVDTELSQNLKVDYVLTVALDAAVRLSKADAGAIHLLDGDTMWVAQVIGDYSRTLVGSHVPLDRGIVGRVVRTQQPDWVEDVSTDPDYLPHVRATESQITIPLISRERTIGVLNVQTSRRQRFTHRIFDFLKLLTARIATAIDNAQLYQQSQNQVTELRQLYQQVSELEQLKTEMIRIAAHDLRNPLGVISGYTQMLGWELDAQLADRHREHLNMIRQSVDRIDKITRDILTLERIEGMARGVLNEPVDLREVVSSAFDEYRARAADKSLDYRLEAPSPAVVSGDSIFLRESVTNLLSNAIKYTPDGGIVQARLVSGAGKVTFEVEDTGYGIPAEHQANLFQPFYRAVTKETKAIKGTGLGLHLVKRIVERHNGQMQFSSVYGQGSTFGFELPLSRGKPGSKRARSARRGKPAAV